MSSGVSRLRPFTIQIHKNEPVGAQFPYLKQDRTASFLPTLHAEGPLRDWLEAQRCEGSLQGAAWLGSHGGAEAMFSWRMTVHARLPTWWHTRAHPSPGNPNHQRNVCYSPSVHLGKKRVEISKVWLKKIRRERDWISSLTQQTLGEMQKAKRMCCIHIPFSEDKDSC